MFNSCVCACVCAFWPAMDTCVAAYALTACSTTGVWFACQPHVLLLLLLSTQDEYKDSPGSVITAGEQHTQGLVCGCGYCSQLGVCTGLHVPACKHRDAVARPCARCWTPVNSKHPSIRQQPRCMRPPCVAAAPADFYGASALLPLTDSEVVDRLKSHIETCEPGFRDAKVIDSAVLRFPKAVTHFSPGSYPSRPYQATGLANTFIAGDWVKGVSSNLQAGGTCRVQCGACMCIGNESVAARLGRTQHGSICRGCSRVCAGMHVWRVCVCLCVCRRLACVCCIRPAGLPRGQRPEPGACVRDWPDCRQPGH